MALVITKLEEEIVGRKRLMVLNVNFDNSYLTGGMPLDLRKFGIKNIHFVDGAVKSGLIVEYDPSAKKLKAYYPLAAHTHVENTAGAYAQNATTGAATAAAAGEIANATDLSALLKNVRLLVLGS